MKRIATSILFAISTISLILVFLDAIHWINNDISLIALWIIFILTGVGGILYSSISEIKEISSVPLEYFILFVPLFLIIVVSYLIVELNAFAYNFEYKLFPIIIFLILFLGGAITLTNIVDTNILWLNNIFIGIGMVHVISIFLYYVNFIELNSIFIIWIGAIFFNIIGLLGISKYK